MKQSECAGGPRQQMTGGIPQRDTAELSGVASLNSIRSGTFNQCSCVRSGVHVSVRTKPLHLTDDIANLLTPRKRQNLCKRSLLSTNLSSQPGHYWAASSLMICDRLRMMIDDEVPQGAFSATKQVRKSTSAEDNCMFGLVGVTLDCRYEVKCRREAGALNMFQKYWYKAREWSGKSEAWSSTDDFVEKMSMRGKKTKGK